jgi:D-alanine-D-alanine ligase
VKRLRVGVVYGGRSSEHEVSLASAASICANLDRKRYEPVPIRIERDGRWALAERLPAVESAAETIERARRAPSSPTRARREVHLIAHPGDETILTVDRSVAGDTGSEDTDRAIVNALALDVIFPIVHGPYGEDGTLQGLLELANIPYVGTGVLASAVGMDKAVMKTLFAAAGLPIVKHEVVRRPVWRANRAETVAGLTGRLAFPLFVKPANLGSSVGISRATDADTLSSAIDLAAQFDRTIVIEEGVTPCREIECGVLGNDTPEASAPGEIIPKGDFYDYEAKYLDTRSETIVPAPLTPEQTDEVRRLAIVAYRAIDGAGMSRVDFLMTSDTGRVFVNEINTHPGFTTISMFAKMWAASGLGYPALLDRLIDLAAERHAEKQESRTSVV